MVEFGFLTACRKQETIGLPWRPVHLDADPPFVVVEDVLEEAGGVYRLRTGTKTDTKTGELGRKVFLVPEAVGLLTRRKEEDRGPNFNLHGFVFPDPRTGDV